MASSRSETLLQNAEDQNSSRSIRAPSHPNELLHDIELTSQSASPQRNELEHIHTSAFTSPVRHQSREHLSPLISIKQSKQSKKSQHALSKNSSARSQQHHH